MAVEMCKLSLWLVSLDRDLPFSFVDDKVFLGNSLLGLTSLDQLRKLHIDPSAGSTERACSTSSTSTSTRSSARPSTCARDLATEIDEDDPARNSAAKRRQLARAARGDRRLCARSPTGWSPPGFALGGKPGKALDEAYENLRIAVRARLPRQAASPTDRCLDAIIDRGLTPTVATDYERWQPLHWVLEAPDVIVEHGGFDAIIGNPPFLGGKKITGAMGTNVRDWLVERSLAVAQGQRRPGRLLLPARRSTALQPTGTLGLIATNTIAQGDTREVGLDQMVGARVHDHRADPESSRGQPRAPISSSQPSGARTATARRRLRRVLDGVAVRRSPRCLSRRPSRAAPRVDLRENRGIAFKGCILLGDGFRDRRADEAQRWIADDPRNAEVLFRYLNGEDLNSRPTRRRRAWVIDFNDR